MILIRQQRTLRYDQRPPTRPQRDWFLAAIVGAAAALGMIAGILVWAVY